MNRPTSVLRAFWDTVLVIEERSEFYDCLYMGEGL
jgi:hypothetical protein